MQNRYRDLERNWLNELSKRSHTRILKTHTFWMSYIALTPEGILWIFICLPRQIIPTRFHTFNTLLHLLFFPAQILYVLYRRYYTCIFVRHIRCQTQFKAFYDCFGFHLFTVYFLVKKQLHCSKTTLK